MNSGRLPFVLVVFVPAQVAALAHIAAAFAVLGTITFLLSFLFRYLHGSSSVKVKVLVPGFRFATSNSQVVPVTFTGCSLHPR